VIHCRTGSVRFIFRIIIGLRFGRLLFGGRGPVQGFELDIVLAKQILIFANAIQELPLGEPAPPWPRRQGRDALRLEPGAVGTRELAITLDLALLAEKTGQYPLRFRWGSQGRAMVDSGRHFPVKRPLSALSNRRGAPFQLLFAVDA